jgi:hypothetical protein
VPNRGIASFVPPASISCQAYERLLAGETVAWQKILQEHPLLGTITVRQLIRAGVVVATQALDPLTGRAEIQLSLHPRRCSPQSSPTDHPAFSADSPASGRGRARTGRLPASSEPVYLPIEAKGSTTRDRC